MDSLVSGMNQMRNNEMTEWQENTVDKQQQPGDNIKVSWALKKAGKRDEMTEWQENIVKKNQQAGDDVKDAWDLEKAGKQDEMSDEQKNIVKKIQQRETICNGTGHIKQHKCAVNGGTASAAARKGLAVSDIHQSKVRCLQCFCILSVDNFSDDSAKKLMKNCTVIGCPSKNKKTSLYRKDVLMVAHKNGVCGAIGKSITMLYLELEIGESKRTKQHATESIEGLGYTIEQDDFRFWKNGKP